MPSGIVGKDWRNDLDIKNSSKIMIILAGDRKVSKYIYDYQAGLKLRIRKEQTNQKNQVTTISEFWIQKNLYVSFIYITKNWQASLIAINTEVNIKFLKSNMEYTYG